MDRILITGAGLVGSHIAQLEVDGGREPVLFDVAPRVDVIRHAVDLESITLVRGDLLEPLDIVRALREHGISRVIHTAAYPGFTPGAVAAPVASVHVNVLGTAHVLEAARIAGIARVVVCSSAAMYASIAGGQDRGAPNREEAYPRTNSIYATTKQAVENLSFNYSDTYGLDTVAVRFPAVFGPPGGGGIGAIAMEGALRAAISSQTVELQPGRAEWIYAKDAARGAHLACWADGLADRCFNIGMDASYSGIEIAEILREQFEALDVKVLEPTVMFGVDGPPMDLTRSRSQLGYEPRYPMPVALQDFAAFLARAG